METTQTPTLTKQQQKHTLSGKKKLQGRSVFASPYDTYWPELEECANDGFNKLLLRSLKPVAKPRVRVQWSKLKKVPQEERRQLRRKMEAEAAQSMSQDEEQKSRENLCLGVNAVTRGLHSSVVASVLLAKDVDPRMLVSHIITMCTIKAVPVLVVPSLRQVTKEALGFSCLAVGFKKQSLEDFKELHDVVKSYSSKIPVPEPLISYQHSLSQQSTSEEEEEYPRLQKKEVNVSTDVYLYYDLNKGHIFEPNEVTLPKPSADFLSISMDTDEEICTPPKFEYRPVRIKTFPLNPEKIRKKNLKKRKNK